jgi:hypothetical protein
VSEPPSGRRAIYPVAAALVVLAAGVALRWPIPRYHGPQNQSSFNDYIFHFLGSYSDIASLYFRDALWRHPVPYADYPLEYPVGMGALIWTLNMARGLVPYMALTAAVLAASGALAVWLVGRVRGANPWLLALSPALAAYVLLNWDLFGLLPMILALSDYDRDRDRRGALWLSAAIWTKFFPLLLLPLVLVDRVLARRYRDAAWSAGIVGAASVLLNAPVAFAHGPGGWHVRPGWSWFFRYSNERPPEVNFWSFFEAWHPSVKTINTGSGVLMVLGMSAVLALLYRAARRGRGGGYALRCALLAIVAWFFFVNKVYSPQYSVWVVALIALCGAPPVLAVAFGAVDAAYFLASFITIGLGSHGHNASDWFFHQALWPCMAVREAALLGVAAWAGWSLSRGLPGARAAGREPASALAGT